MFKLSDNGFTDILIYILIIVGGLIANAYKNYSKRKENEKKANNPQPQNPIFPEVLFEPVFEKYIEPEEEPEIDFEEKEELLDSPISEIDSPEPEIIPAQSFTEGTAVFERTDKIIQTDSESVGDLNEDDLTNIKDFDREEETKKSSIEFDVAKAVIYSEILKPKYF